MRNFNELVGQLNQDAPLFCEEAVLRIVVDMFLQKQKHIQNLIPIFRGFHTEKCLQHSNGKYIRSWRSLFVKHAHLELKLLILF